MARMGGEDTRKARDRPRPSARAAPGHARTFRVACALLAREETVGVMGDGSEDEALSQPPFILEPPVALGGAPRPPAALTATGRPPAPRASWPGWEALAPPAYTIADLERYLAGAATRTRRTPGFAAFFASLGPLRRARFERLWCAVRELEHGRDDAAAVEAEALTRGMPDEEDGHDAVLVRTFAEAILGRIRRIGGGGNLYLGARPPGAQLRAFELLRLRTPLIPFGYAAANRALLSSVGAPGDVTLLDLGIGRGGQICALLKHPWALRRFRTLHVIGVEPDSAPGPGGGPAPSSSPRSTCSPPPRRRASPPPSPASPSWRRISPSPTSPTPRRGGSCSPTAASACTTSACPRTAPRAAATTFLAVVRDAGCARVVLLEPDSDHLGDDLTLRFLYAYRHYGTLFHSLCATLDASDAMMVWSEFFAQEVRNVTTHEGAQRVERHEEAEAWRERLRSAGFVVDTPPELVARSAAPAGFEVGGAGGTCTLSYEGVSLLGVLRGRRA